MDVSDVLVKMIEYSQGNLHDINHFLKVYAYAKTIGEQEKLSRAEQEIVEIAAIVHDIACPLCREKYGCTDGKYQEAEGMVLARDFLEAFPLSDAAKDRIVYLVGHHHTLQGISGMDYQILIEADYLVNADESCYSDRNLRNTLHTIFKTQTGIALLRSVYGVA